MNDLLSEAQIISKYLIGSSVSPALANRYVAAVTTLKADLPESQHRLWKKCLSSQLLLSVADSGLALADPFSKIRYRIYIMFCILESTPEFASHFLPKKRSAWFIIRLLWEMSVAALKGVAGYLLIKIVYRAEN